MANATGRAEGNEAGSAEGNEAGSARAGAPARREGRAADPRTRSPALAGVLRAADKAASSAIPVLIEGESGAGKEWLARTIHAASPRADRPMVAINCGAIPHQLVESILFGHEKGAFTGASERTQGKFREADGGTLFLDEVGELPLDAQVKLLRVLQSGEIEPVGAARPVKVDVRIVSATNRRLAHEVAQGRFREDLFYRLGVFPLLMPPLRERREDIADLAATFAVRFGTECGGASRLSDAALHRLAGHDWPGNVRELENAIYRAVVLSEGDTLQARDVLPAEAPEPVPMARAMPDEEMRRFEAALGGGEPEDSRSVPMPSPAFGATTLRMVDGQGALRPLSSIERDAIEAALQRCGGRMSEVARGLGIGRSTLYRKCAEYGIEAAQSGRAAA